MFYCQWDPARERTIYFPRNNVLLFPSLLLFFFCKFLLRFQFFTMPSVCVSSSLSLSNGIVLLPWLFFRQQKIRPLFSFQIPKCMGVCFNFLFSVYIQFKSDLHILLESNKLRFKQNDNKKSLAYSNLFRISEDLCRRCNYGEGKKEKPNFHRHFFLIYSISHALSINVVFIVIPAKKRVLIWKKYLHYLAKMNYHYY